MNSTFKYSKETILNNYVVKPIEKFSNIDQERFQSLLQQFPNMLKSCSFQPLSIQPEIQQRMEFNDILLNTPTPMKTAGVQRGAQAQDFFSFEDKTLTPKPVQNTENFTYNPTTPHRTRKVVTNPVFAYSDYMKCGGLTDRVWYYIDSKDKFQGPFSTIEMDAWYTKGYFSDSTEISFMSSSIESFVKLWRLKKKKRNPDEAQLYKNLIGRRRSAPKIIVQLINQVTPSKGPKTSQQKKVVFEFDNINNDLEQYQEVQQKQKEPQIDATIQKVLSIPDKIGKNKKI